MNELMDKRHYFNVLKGFAIFLVVVGHATGGLVHEYAYSYHLALFFFISGFLYNENKYGNNPALNIGNKIKNNWSKFVIYTGLIGLLHFVGNINTSFPYIFGGVEAWDLSSYRNYFLNNMVMNNTEALCGAMWFVAPLIVVSGLMGLIIYLGNRMGEITGKSWAKHATIVFLTLICLYLGNERMNMKFQLQMRLDVALFVLPLLIIAYYINTYIKNYLSYLRWYIAIPCFCLTVFMCSKQIQNVLAGQFVELKTFYAFSLIGIYQSMCLAKILCDEKKVGKNIITIFFDFIGKYTFEIMAFHFVVFKVIDAVWYKCKGEVDTSVLTVFPHSYNLWPIYILLGCLLPAVISVGIERIKRRVIHM